MVGRRIGCRAQALARGILIIIGLLVAGPALAETAAAIQLIGADGASHSVKVADLAAMAPVPVAVTFKTAHGEEQGRYQGPLLWTVLTQAGLLAEADHKGRLRQGILVSGRDGYRVLIAIAEIDPEFEGKSVILAVGRDGQPDPDHQIRLIVPGDQRGGRAVRDVVEVRLVP